MGSYYDITNPDTSYYWLHEVLHLKKGELIEKYCIDCHNDSEVFYEMYLSEIQSLDIENMDIVAFQVTSNNNKCAEIKKNGLHNLQWVLSNDTELNFFLQQRGIHFDIEKRIMYIDADEYDVNYDKYRKLNYISVKKEGNEKVGHKLYYDFQINAFLFCGDINRYGVIHKVPEFLFTLATFNEKTVGIDKQWEKYTKPYVVKFKAKFKDFAYFTFYGWEEEYVLDSQNNWMELRKTLISKAINSTFSNSVSEIFAYMKPEKVISPDDILEYIPAEKWRKDVLKYFGKE
jgi:hypothetical protein